jgi:hypothetical protein
VLDGGLTGDADRDQRFNPLTYDGERDHFFEPHYEAVHSWAISPHISATGTWFYFNGEGLHDEQRFAQNLTDYRLTPWATSDTLLFPHAYYRDADGGRQSRSRRVGNATVERARRDAEALDLEPALRLGARASVSITRTARSRSAANCAHTMAITSAPCSAVTGSRPAPRPIMRTTTTIRARSRPDCSFARNEASAHCD